MSTLINVLIVDDSPTVRLMLRHIISSASQMRVVGEANDGHQAVRMACDLRPDVVLMDVIMPNMNGIDAIQEIMHLAPTPIIAVSASMERRETDAAFQAIKAGALAAVGKPVGLLSEGHHEQVAHLLNTIRAMAGVSVIHHWKRVVQAQSAVPAVANAVAPQIVGIVSSTGGPGALCDILQSLPADFPLPIVIVQHIAPDFMPSLQGWLAGNTYLKVLIAQPGGTPLPGHVYLAPANAHLRLTAGRRFEMIPEQGKHQHMPAGNELLESLAKVYKAAAAGIVLTGMGTDGARGLRMMHDMGAFTIAQDEASSVVYGMPREAAAIGAARQILPLSSIANALVSLARTAANTGSTP